MTDDFTPELAELFEHNKRLWDTDPHPASTEQVEAARAYCRDHCGGELPPSLLDLWRQTDGFGANFAQVYGPDEAVRTTELYVADYPQWFMVGDHGDHAMFAWDLTAQQWVTLEQGDFDYGPRATRSSLHELVQHVAQAALKKQEPLW